MFLLFEVFSIWLQVGCRLNVDGDNIRDTLVLALLHAKKEEQKYPLVHTRLGQMGRGKYRLICTNICVNCLFLIVFYEIDYASLVIVGNLDLIDSTLDEHILDRCWDDVDLAAIHSEASIVLYEY